MFIMNEKFSDWMVPSENLGMLIYILLSITFSTTTQSVLVVSRNECRLSRELDCLFLCYMDICSCVMVIYNS